MSLSGPSRPCLKNSCPQWPTGGQTRPGANDPKRPFFWLPGPKFHLLLSLRPTIRTARVRNLPRVAGDSAILRDEDHWRHDDRDDRRNGDGTISTLSLGMRFIIRQ